MANKVSKKKTARGSSLSVLQVRVSRGGWSHRPVEKALVARRGQLAQPQKQSPGFTFTVQNTRAPFFDHALVCQLSRLVNCAAQARVQHQSYRHQELSVLTESARPGRRGSKDLTQVLASEGTTMTRSPREVDQETNRTARGVCARERERSLQNR